MERKALVKEVKTLKKKIGELEKIQVHMIKEFAQISMQFGQLTTMAH